MTNGNAALDQIIANRESGAGILASIEQFLGRFVAYPSIEARIAHTLWIAHTHAMQAWESTPRIAFLSPEPGSGKTRALEVTELLVPNAVEAVNVSPAYLFRKVGSEDGPPTILFDEIDTVFGPKARDNEEIRGLLNAGHRRGAVAGRCVVRGKTVETEEISAYCAVALAGLDDLPDTIRTRSIIIRMRRRAPSEIVEPYRRRVHERDGHSLRNRLSDWIATVDDRLTGAWPKMPSGIEDRNADVWEPLLAIADAAGGEWPETAREAAIALVAASQDDTPSLGIRLLKDIMQAFVSDERLSTNDLIDRLCTVDDAPWSDLRGKPLNPRKLSNLLKRYGIERRDIRIGEWHGKGYAKEDFRDAFARYLGPLQQESVTSATSVTNAVDEIVDQPSNVTLVTDVTDLEEAILHPCDHCGRDHSEDNPVNECYVGHQMIWLHHACQDLWLEQTENEMGVQFVSGFRG